MPEGLEAEIYRRSAERCVGRTITSVTVDERQTLAAALRATLPGLTIGAARRHGKLVLLDTRTGRRSGPTVGLHFGMTGRLVVDGRAPIGRLEYASGRDDPAWDRLVIGFDGDGAMRVNDPRRWATFDLDPDESRLGPDFLSIDRAQLAAALGRRRAVLKSVLLNQAVVAGFGNLCVDEVLWQAALSPLVRACDLAPGDIDDLVEAMRTHLPAMLERGGSHRGTIDPHVRAALPPCPRDGGAMRREVVGGRTTVWCPVHQRSPRPH